MSNDRKNRKDRNIELWVDALRSGLYKQGYGQLHKEDEFCCLGVACEVYQREVGDLAVDTNDLEWAYDGRVKILPDIVRIWLGLRNPIGETFNKSSLAWLNDNGTSFDKIADFIESCPAGLFMEED